MTAITAAQPLLPGLGNDAKLVERIGSAPVDITVGDVKLEGALVVRPLKLADVASAADRTATLQKLGDADGILARGADGSAYLIEGQRLSVGRSRPSVGWPLSFSVAGKLLAGSYTIEAFYRGPGGLSKWDVEQRLHASGAAKVVQPDTNIYDDSKLGTFSIGCIGVAIGAALGGVAAFVLGATGAGMLDIADWGFGTQILPAIVDSSIAQTIAGGLLAADATVAVGSFLLWEGTSVALEIRSRLRQRKLRAENKAIDAADARDNGVGVRTVPNKPRPVPALLRS